MSAFYACKLFGSNYHVTLGLMLFHVPSHWSSHAAQCGQRRRRAYSQSQSGQWPIVQWPPQYREFPESEAIQQAPQGVRALPHQRKL